MSSHKKIETLDIIAILAGYELFSESDTPSKLFSRSTKFKDVHEKRVLPDCWVSCNPKNLIDQDEQMAMIALLLLEDEDDDLAVPATPLRVAEECEEMKTPIQTKQQVADRDRSPTTEVTRQVHFGCLSGERTNTKQIEFKIGRKIATRNLHFN